MERPQESQLNWIGQWAGEDAELHARKMMAYERACLMEKTLEAVGFTGLCYRLGVMLAKVASNWEPVVRELSAIADDKELQINSKNPKCRRDAARRALSELQKWGLLEYSSVQGTSRRRTRPTSKYEIKIDPRKLARLAEGEAPIEIATNPRQTSNKQSDKQSDKPATDQQQLERQTSDKSQRAIIETLSPSNPKSQAPSPSSRKEKFTEGEVVRVFLDLGVRQAMEYVPAAAERGCSMRDLLAIARWFERSQHRHPTRWDKPATILAVRLGKALPGVPAWMGWTEGRPMPRSKPKPYSVPSYRSQRAAAIAASANSESMTEMFQRLSSKRSIR